MTKSLPIEKRINPLKKRMIHILHKDVYDKINELADRLNHIGDANEMVTPSTDKAKCPCPCHKGDTDTCFCFCSPQPDMEEIGHEIFEYIWDIDEVTFDKAGEQAKKILDFLTANYTVTKKK